MIALLGLLAAAHAAPSPFGVPTRWLDALRRAEFTSVDRQMVHASHTCSLRVDADCDGADPSCATWGSGALVDVATAGMMLPAIIFASKFAAEHARQSAGINCHWRARKTTHI